LLASANRPVKLDGEAMNGLPPARRKQAHDLVLGVRRHKTLLDAVLRRFLKSPVKAVPVAAREALRCGTYDLLFNERVPAAAVVSDTVELMGRDRRLRGLTNAVLRRVAESFVIVESEDVPEDRHHVPVGPGRVARFERAILPDPTTDLVRFHAVRYSLTEWFVAAIMRELPLEHHAFFRACGRRMPMALRPVAGNTLALLRDQVLAAGSKPGRCFEDVLEVQLSGPLSELAPLTDGRAVVQDQVAAEVAPFLDPQPGERVLDLCAPPGGKTVHMAELMSGQGEIVAAHLGTRPVRRLKENVERFGWESLIRLHDLGAEGQRMPDGPFDRVLVDAPCSNTGVLMKRVDARYRVREDNLRSLIELQDRLLGSALRLVREGGVVVYSTCSVLRSENHEVVSRAVQGHSGAALVEERLRYPHRTGRDGGYMASIRRDGMVTSP